MDTYTVVKNRILSLCKEHSITINKLATKAGIPASTLKNILYGKSQNPGVVTIKMLCDGFGISITEFFDTAEFRKLEQEMK